MFHDDRNSSFLLRHAVMYANPKVFKFMAENTRFINTDPQKSSNFMEQFVQGHGALGRILDEYLNHYNWFNHDYETNTFIEGREELAGTWSYIAADFLMRTEYFGEEPIPQADGAKKILGGCFQDHETLDLLVEYGAPITWEHVEKLYDFDNTHPLKARLIEIATSSPFSEVVVVNHYSPADMFERTEKFTNGAIDNKDLASFHSAMQLIEQGENGLTIIQRDAGQCVFSGKPEAVNESIMGCFYDYATEKMPRGLLEVAQTRIAPLLGVEEKRTLSS